MPWISRCWRLAAALLLCASCTFWPRGSATAGPGDINLERLLAAIQQVESQGEPFPDGAVNIETLPSGEHTIARGRYQITETTWKQYTALHVSYAHEPGRAKGVALLILLDCLKWYPGASYKRLAYCWTAGKQAVPYRRKDKLRYAERVAALVQ